MKTHSRHELPFRYTTVFLLCMYQRNTLKWCPTKRIQYGHLASRKRFKLFHLFLPAMITEKVICRNRFFSIALSLTIIVT